MSSTLSHDKRPLNQKLTTIIFACMIAFLVAMPVTVWWADESKKDWTSQRLRDQGFDVVSVRVDGPTTVTIRAADGRLIEGIVRPDDNGEKPLPRAYVLCPLSPDGSLLTGANACVTP